MIVGYLGYFVMVSVAASSELGPLFIAIRAVETFGAPTPNQAIGDDGKSIGPYQISRAYWRDSGMRGRWTRCRGQAYSEEVMLAYWKQHCPAALRQRDFEVLARIHNGGPNGQTKFATISYWHKVRQAMNGRLAAAPRNRALALVGRVDTKRVRPRHRHPARDALKVNDESPTRNDLFSA